jgi:hypothetical protein
MAPRIVLIALSIAFSIAVATATFTTVRQLNLRTKWHSAQSTDGQSRAKARTSYSSNSYEAS